MKYVYSVLLAVTLISSLPLSSCRLAYQKGQESNSQSGSSPAQQQAPDTSAGSSAPSNPQAGSSSTQGGATANQPPQARIISISPNEASQGDTISFKGEGTDADGTVKVYLWKSNIDGALSREVSFSTDMLSAGTHIISFQVMDNRGAKSGEVNSKLVIHKLTQAPVVTPTGRITNVSVVKGSVNNFATFYWTISELDPHYEYWVYLQLASGPNSSSPEAQAQHFGLNYEVAVSECVAASGNRGDFAWNDSHPPSGTLALLAYDPINKKCYVADISEPIDTTNWQGL